MITWASSAPKTQKWWSLGSPIRLRFWTRNSRSATLMQRGRLRRKTAASGWTVRRRRDCRNVAATPSSPGTRVCAAASRDSRFDRLCRTSKWIGCGRNFAPWILTRYNLYMYYPSFDALIQEYSHLLSNRLEYTHLRVYIIKQRKYILINQPFKDIRISYVSKKITFNIESNDQWYSIAFSIDIIECKRTNDTDCIKSVDITGGADKSITFCRPSVLNNDDVDASKANLQKLADTLTGLFSAIEKYKENPRFVFEQDALSRALK